jgi:hypothetical protein
MRKICLLEIRNISGSYWNGTRVSEYLGNVRWLPQAENDLNAKSLHLPHLLISTILAAGIRKEKSFSKLQTCRGHPDVNSVIRLAGRLDDAQYGLCSIRKYVTSRRICIFSGIRGPELAYSPIAVAPLASL